MLLAVFSAAVGANAQSVTGKVTDEKGQPITGVLVTDTNSLIRTISNSNGAFAIPNKKGDALALKFHAIGFRDTVLTVSGAQNIDLKLEHSSNQSDEVLVLANVVDSRTPIAFTNLDRKAVEPLNLGQDLPFMLRFTPSLVVTSDAGNGIGYTGMRIRGSDASRINVTINGIPLNDAESHGVFFVNMPDFVSSVQDIQIQRGVGTSTNGAGAFGGTVNLQTGLLSNKPYATVASSGGSFNTLKNTVQFGTGIMKNNFAFEGRLSTLKSDGYIDRSSSNLKSYFLQGGYYGKKTVVKLIHFNGAERTYQSWYGTPESRVNNDTAGMVNHALNNGYTPAQTINLLNAGRTYNYYLYKNQTDNYRQSHFQALLSHSFNSNLSLNLAGHYTHGEGYYEEFKEGDNFSKYGLGPFILGNDTVKTTDLVRQRWLNNDFVGLIGSLKGNSTVGGKGFEWVVGGAINSYIGYHYGNIIWAQYAGNIPKDYEYYRAKATKTDANAYAKATYAVTSKINVWADLQMRTVSYSGSGLNNTGEPANFDTTYKFFNPKGGVMMQLENNSRLFASVAVGHREPNRADFIDGRGNTPSPEQMTDFEAGYQVSRKKWTLEANAYFMNYKNQLVLTGALNDVGTPLRINVPNSYRAGIELMGNAVIIPNKLKFQLALTLSQNRIKHYTELIFNYDTYGYDSITHHNAQIAFSPNQVLNGMLTWTPVKGLTVCWMANVIGRQYLDNSQVVEGIFKKYPTERSIAAYAVNDLRFSYSLKPSGMRELLLNLTVNNVLNTKYVSNGYTYSYIYGGRVTENFYYPQATRNFLAGVTFKF